MTEKQQPANSVWVALALAVVVLVAAIGIVYATKSRFVATTPPVVIVQDLPVAGDLASYSMDEWWVAGSQPRPFGGRTPTVFPRNTIVTVRGWAFSPDAGPAVAVFGLIDDVTYFHSDGGLPRGDVAAALHRPDAANSGFTMSFGTQHLRPGRHTLRVAVTSPSLHVIHESPAVSFTVR